MNILIAPDKFKGTLDAAGVARALARGWRAARPQDRLRLLPTATGNDLHRLPGAGAAGGLGFGLAAFAGARLVPGFEVFRGLTGLDAHLRWADVVVTGEGRFDASSVMGKGVGCLVDLALEQSRKCLVFAGEAAPDRRRRLAACRGLTQVTTVAEAMRDPARWLTLLVRDTVEGLKLA